MSNWAHGYDPLPVGNCANIKAKGILEKFQHRSALPNIKYNCTVLYLCLMYLLFVNPSKYIFS